MPSADKARVVRRRAKRYEVVHNCAITATGTERATGLGPPAQREEIQPSAKQWRNFRRTLDRLNVWSWQGNYPNSPMVCDGVGWSAEIATRIDRSSLPAITAFRGGTEERFPLPS